MPLDSVKQFGLPSITYLPMFLCGYNYARQAQGLDLTPQAAAFEQFQNWVQQRFKITSTVSWDKIILLYSANEQAGFELFFDLLSQFCQSQEPQTDGRLGTAA